MKRFTKALCMLLALVMVAGLLPLSILADGTQATHTVKFNLNYNGAHQIPAQTVEHGQCATQPGNVTREGWIFQYWYVKTGDGIQKFDLTQPVTEDMTLYARWDEDINYWGPIWGRNLQAAADAGKAHGNTYTVTFDPNGTDVTGMPAAQRVKEGGYATEPAEPSRAGYTFLGWLLDSNGTKKFDFRSPVKSELTLFALWANTTNNSDSTYITDTEHIQYDEFEKLYYIDNILLVFTQDGLSIQEKDNIASTVNGVVVGSLESISNILQIRVEPNTASGLSSLSEQLMELDTVYFAMYDMPQYDISVDGIYSYKDSDTWNDDNWNENSPDGSNWAWEAMHVYSAWKNYSDYFSKVRVGVIDNGFDPDHTELFGKIQFPSSKYSKENTIESHGTGVSGIIAASNNTVGLCGVAYNSTLYCVSTNSFHSKSGGYDTFVDFAMVFDDFLSHEIKVVNISLGHHFYDNTLYKNSDLYKKGMSYDEYIGTTYRMMRDEGKLYAAYVSDKIIQGYDPLYIQSAGNGLNNFYETPVDAFLSGLFAACDSIACEYMESKFKLSNGDIKSHILIVSSIINEKTTPSVYKRPGSNTGNTVDICAPGKYIYTTDINGGYYYEYDKTLGKKVGKFGGTSAAAPFVTGVAALVWSVNPSLTAPQVKQILTIKTLCYAEGDGHDITRGLGLSGTTLNLPTSYFIYPVVNAEFAVKEALATSKSKVKFNFIENSSLSGSNEKLNSSSVKVKTLSYDGYYENLAETEIDAEWLFNELSNESSFSAFLPVGTYLFEFSAKGYTTTTKIIEITPSTNKVTIYMTPDGETPPTPTDTKTMRIRFVDSDTQEVLKISDVIPDNFALLSIGHTSQASDFLYSYINPPKGFTIENGTDFVFPEIPVITAPGNYTFTIKYFSDTYFLPGYYGDYTIDSFKTSSSAAEWSIDVPVMQKKLIVGDVRVTPDNAADILGDGTAKYDYTTNTLTLTNATITAYDVIYAQLDSLHVVIPENTTTILHSLLEHNDDWGDMEGDVISQIGGLYISGGGTLSMRGSKGLTKFGRDVTTRFCAFADYIRMDNITIEVDEYIDGGFYCEPGDIELKNTHITFSSLNYNLLFSCGDITISDSVINCLSGEYLSIHAHYKTFITNSTLTLNALTPHIDCDDLSVYNSVVHIKNAKEIHMEGRSAITLTGVKIVTPANGIIYNNGETYYIANPDGSYPTEILIR